MFINMKTDGTFLSSEFMKSISNEEYNFKMNTSNSDCDPNSSSLAHSDSGYLTNYNQESHSFSTSSSGLSSEDLYPQKPIDSELSLQNNIYFCENAVFDEPNLEGPPILFEDISIDLNSIIQNDFLVPNAPKCNVEQSLLNMDSGSSSSKSDVSSFEKVKSSAEKKTPLKVNESPRVILNTSDSDTSFSSQTNDFPFNQLRISAEELANTTISSVSSSVSSTKCVSAEKQRTNLVNVNITPNKPIINNNDVSPELFSEDEEPEEEILPLSNITISLEVLSQTQKPIVQNEQLLRNDRKLLRRVQEAITGVPPPPSVTILQTTVTDMLNKIHSNKYLFLTDIYGDEEKTDNKIIDQTKQNVKSLLIVNNKEEISRRKWPEILNFRYHGLHHNRTKISEDFEFYCTKYATRYVGVETASSCTVWSTNLPGSAKKRNARLRWGAKSPGRRLSHLAKRRITFSSSNLQASCSTAVMSVIGSTNATNRHFVIDARKSSGVSKRRSPWKKSPRKSPLKKIKTPGSSTKKNTRRQLYEDQQPGTSRVVSTKRALFQSPEHNRSTTSTSTGKPRSIFSSPHKNSPAKIKNSPLKLNYASSSNSKPRRNLFISPKKQSPATFRSSPSKINCDSKKRKRPDEDLHPNKFPRSLSFDAQHSKALQSAAGGISIQRRHSELNVSNVKTELSDLHKKKLLWAVSESLRSQQIGMSHPKFRTFAPILCKIVKYLMPDLLSNGLRQPGSTSDRMLRIARQYVFAVSRGKTYEEVIQQIKESEFNIKNLRQPTGYVPPDSFKSDEKMKHVLQDKVLNIECNQTKVITRSPDIKVGSRDENNRARIKRQILFDDIDVSKGSNLNR